MCAPIHEHKGPRRDVTDEDKALTAKIAFWTSMVIIACFVCSFVLYCFKIAGIL